MASRLKQRRTANKKVLTNLLTEAKELIGSDYDEVVKNKIEVLLTSIELKDVLIKQLDSDILDVIPEENIEADVDTAAQFEVKVNTELCAIRNYLKVNDVRKGSDVDSLSTLSCKRAAVKLPKIFIKKFSGNPIEWQQFHETFKATVDQNEGISDIEKFTYLKGYVEGSASKCIEGINLSNENYKHALDLLSERYGNPQLIISSHMNQILKVNKVTAGHKAKELRNLYDKIESHVRSLITVGVQSDHYGPLLIPIVLDKLPDDIKLIISRKLGSDNWKINEFMDILKVEIAARESCEFMKHSDNEFKRNQDTEIKDKRHSTELFLTTNQRVLKCAFCGQQHYHDKCNVVTNLEARKEIISKNKLCYKCLFPGHIRRDCRSKSKCYRCKAYGHNTAICDKNKIPVIDPPKEEGTFMVNSKTSVLLQTSTAIVSDNKDRKNVTIKVLMDSGSQKTYLSERIVKHLNLKPIGQETMVVKTFGGKNGQSMNLNKYEFCVKGVNDGCSIYLKGFSVPLICSPLSGQRIDVVKEQFPFLKELDLADKGKGDSEIDLLIGADFYWNVIEGEIRRCGSGGPIAVNSKLGWMLSGPFVASNVDECSMNLAVTHVMKINIDVGDDVLSRKVERFWDLDSVGVLENEKSVYDKFADDICFKDNRYEVKLPFKENQAMIEDNYNLSVKRLDNLKRRLDKNPKLLQEYNEIIQSQIKADIVEKVESPGEVGAVTYLPHRAVVRDDKKSTKVRVVFDASAKNKGASLNECLYKGPCLNPLLYDVLLRFRVFNIAITGDIEKAYLQISVSIEDRDYLRFLWFDDIYKDNPEILKYRFTRVIFGATCSQFLLNGTVKTHAEKYDKIDPEFSKKVLRHFYVDDFNSGVNNVTEGVDLYKKMKLRFQEGNFNIRKWRSNNAQLIKVINNIENEVEGINNKNKEEIKNGDKILGIMWREPCDVLVINLNDFINEDVISDLVTKRNVLKVIAGFYDPLGFIQPIVVQLKIMFQEICSKNYDWDEEISKELKLKWFKLINSMKNVNEFVIDRCYCLSEINDPFVCIEIHGFSDASEIAYGGCIYFKFIKKSGNIKVSFVTSKSRVAPLKKKLSIPRMELMGNLIVSRLLLSVTCALKEEMKFDKIYCWTDSQVALAWIKAVNKELKTFVQNRVIEIRKNVAIEKWFYCKSIQNPADIITRTTYDVRIINDSLWLNGPMFLQERDNLINYDNYAEYNIDDSPAFNSEVIVQESIMVVVEDKNSPSIENIIDLTKYSNVLKLFRVTSYVIRFINNLKRKRNNQVLISSKYVKADEMNEAKLIWIKVNQEYLKNDMKYKELVLSLNIQEDDNGILRTYSRLKNARIPFDTKAPIMIYKEHYLSKLLVYYYHLKVLHKGVKQTLTELRSCYWITRGRSYVKKLLHPCTLCKKFNSRPYEYPGHSDLPELRFDDNYPFSSTGVDYLGPLLCLPIYGAKDKLYKAFVVLYTCASTRAVILEVVHNANARTFISSFNRFISRRGCPSVMVSDNGPSFKAEETQSFISNRYIKWKFNVESAPWWGGMWERLVASVTKCIKIVVGIRRINYIELQTLILEIEVILNNRPIGVDYDDDQEDVLTPNHLIFGRKLLSQNDNHEINEHHDSSSNEDLIKRKKMLSIILDHFWQRWRKEYLTSLREIQQKDSHNKSTKINENDVVLVYEDKQPRHLWKLGKVTKLLPSRDGKIRSAEIKVGKTNRIISRPVNRLYPLNIFKSDNVHNTDTQSDNTVNRPKRSAAIIGELKRKFAS